MREAEDAGGSKSKSGDIGEKKKIWIVKASKHESTMPEHTGTQRFDDEPVVGGGLLLGAIIKHVAMIRSSLVWYGDKILILQRIDYFRVKEYQVRLG